MCARISTGRPGSWQSLITNKGTMLGIYGFNQGSLYNARFEGIHTTWKNLNSNRAILRVESFFEGKGEFTRADKNKWNIGCLYKGEEFAILTVLANDTVKKFHGRMPLLLTDTSIDEFLSGDDNLCTFPEDLFRVNQVLNLS